MSAHKPERLNSFRNREVEACEEVTFVLNSKTTEIRKGMHTLTERKVMTSWRYNIQFCKQSSFRNRILHDTLQLHLGAKYCEGIPYGQIAIKDARRESRRHEKVIMTIA